MAIIYIASKFELKDKVQELYEDLLSYGHMVTLVWWTYEAKKVLENLSDDDFYGDKRVRFIKSRDLFSIDECDIFVLLSDYENELNFNGANFEMGYATAQRKEIYIIGKLGRSAIYHGATWCKDIDEFLCKIKDE
jgi:nucleoside 2-deoxyribosyltransferase